MPRKQKQCCTCYLIFNSNFSPQANFSHIVLSSLFDKRLEMLPETGGDRNRLREKERERATKRKLGMSYFRKKEIVLPRGGRNEINGVMIVWEGEVRRKDKWCEHAITH